MSRIDVRMPAGEGHCHWPDGHLQTPDRAPVPRAQLYAAATTFSVADITEIRILVNGPVFQRFSGAQRDVMNKFDGRAPRDHRRNQLPARDPL